MRRNCIRLKKSEFVYDLKVRARSLFIILMAALLFLASGVIDLIKVFAGDYIGKYWEKGGLFLATVINEIASLLVITIWFMVLFKYLANGRPSWRATAAGGILTGILFYLGKAALATLMGNSNFGAVYGAGAAIPKPFILIIIPNITGSIIKATAHYVTKAELKNKPKDD